MDTYEYQCFKSKSLHIMNTKQKLIQKLKSITLEEIQDKKFLCDCGSNDIDGKTIEDIEEVHDLFMTYRDMAKDYAWYFYVKEGEEAGVDYSSWWQNIDAEAEGNTPYLYKEKFRFVKDLIEKLEND